MNISNAAHNLFDIELKSGWKVIEKIEKEKNATGSFFSVAYKVKKDDEICFLKAFDFAKFFNPDFPGRSIVDYMKEMIDAFKYEKDISNICKNNRLSKVAVVREAGEEEVLGYTIPVVPYLIFDMADGDVRKLIKFNNELDYAWKLKSLHDIAVGVRQLHSIDISHQDIKPSNILMFGDNSKIGDLGRAVAKLLDAPHKKLPFSGDFTYAPPEILYGYYEQDWSKRVRSIDSYLLGSMVVFYFSGISMSALLSNHIPTNLRWDKFRGSFEEVKTYLVEAFFNAINEFKDTLQNELLKNELINIVEQLCYPLPERRGHPKDIKSIGSSYNLERYISKFELLHKKFLYTMTNRN